MTNADSWTLYTINEICKLILYIFDPRKHVLYLNISLGILQNSSSDARSTDTMKLFPVQLTTEFWSHLSSPTLPESLRSFLPFHLLG